MLQLLRPLLVPGHSGSAQSFSGVHEQDRHLEFCLLRDEGLVVVVDRSDGLPRHCIFASSGTTMLFLWQQRALKLRQCCLEAAHRDLRVVASPEPALLAWNPWLCGSECVGARGTKRV